MVTEQNTALALGSGTVEVFATPAIVNLIEYTCARSVENEVEAGQTTAVSYTHLDVYKRQAQR